MAGESGPLIHKAEAGKQESGQENRTGGGIHPVFLSISCFPAENPRLGCSQALPGHAERPLGLKALPARHKSQLKPLSLKAELRTQPGCSPRFSVRLPFLRFRSHFSRFSRIS